MLAHPVLDLTEQNVLGLRVSEQVVKFDRWLGSLDNDFKLFVRLLNAIKCRVVIDVLNSFTVELMMESL